MVHEVTQQVEIGGREQTPGKLEVGILRMTTDKGFRGGLRSSCAVFWREGNSPLESTVLCDDFSKCVKTTQGRATQKSIDRQHAAVFTEAVVAGLVAEAKAFYAPKVKLPQLVPAEANLQYIVTHEDSGGGVGTLITPVGHFSWDEMVAENGEDFGFMEKLAALKAGESMTEGGGAAVLVKVEAVILWHCAGCGEMYKPGETLDAFSARHPRCPNQPDYTPGYGAGLEEPGETRGVMADA